MPKVAKELEELTEEEGLAEAQELVARNPLRLPTYRLERIHVATLNVDYAPPFGSGYARPLSDGRLKQLRREWDPLAVSPLTLSRRRDNTLWVIDGNHRRVVSFEKGMNTLPAMVHSGLSREQEADLYTKLGTVLGQTPWTRFQAKLIALDPAALAITRIADKHGLVIDATKGYGSWKIRAVARVEWVYARGGEEGLDWVLSFLSEAYDGNAEALGEMQLEGVFQFWARYRDKVQRSEIARMVGAAGINAWHDRAASIWQRVDVGMRSNTYGMAIAEMTNDVWRKKGKGGKQLLAAWQTFPVNPGAFTGYRDIKFSTRMLSGMTVADHVNPAPQQLTIDQANE